MKEEKRKRKRVEYDVDVQLRRGETWLTVQSENISMGGILVLMAGDIAVGDKCRVKISTDAELKTLLLTTDVEVVRVDTADDETKQKVAMKFTSLDFDSSVTLFNIVRYMTGGDWHTTSK